jgi:hypothetical protein
MTCGTRNRTRKKNYIGLSEAPDVVGFRAELFQLTCFGHSSSYEIRDPFLNLLHLGVLPMGYLWISSEMVGYGGISLEIFGE